MRGLNLQLLEVADWAVIDDDGSLLLTIGQLASRTGLAVPDYPVLV